MYFLLKIWIFQPVMLVFKGVTNFNSKNFGESSRARYGWNAHGRHGLPAHGQPFKADTLKIVVFSRLRRMFTVSWGLPSWKLTWQWKIHHFYKETHLQLVVSPMCKLLGFQKCRRCYFHLFWLWCVLFTLWGDGWTYVEMNVSDGFANWRIFLFACLPVFWGSHLSHNDVSKAFSG